MRRCAGSPLILAAAVEGDQMRMGVPITLLNTDRTGQQFNLADEFLSWLDPPLMLRRVRNGNAVDLPIPLGRDAPPTPPHD